MKLVRDSYVDDNFCMDNLSLKWKEVTRVAANKGTNWKVALLEHSEDGLS